MLLTRRLFCVALIVLVCLCASIQAENFIGKIFGTLYAGVSSAGRAVSDQAHSIYVNRVKDKLASSKNEVVKKCQEITVGAQKIGTSISEAETYLPSVTQAVTALTAEQAAYLNPKIDELKKIAKKIKENPGAYMPQTEEEAQQQLTAIQDYVLGLQVKELKIDAEMTMSEKFKYYFFSAVNLPLRFTAFLIRGLIASGHAFLVFSVLITIMSIYYAYKKALAFVKVLWFFVKLPFRIMYGILHFIWCLIFGSSEDKEAAKDAPLGFEISEAALEEECGCACNKHNKSTTEKADADKKASATEKTGSDKKASLPKKTDAKARGSLTLSQGLTGDQDAEAYDSSNYVADDSDKDLSASQITSDAVTQSMTLLVGAVMLALF